jgi:hypothetical protein
MRHEAPIKADLEDILERLETCDSKDVQVWGNSTDRINLLWLAGVCSVLQKYRRKLGVKSEAIEK